MPSLFFVLYILVVVVVAVVARPVSLVSTRYELLVVLVGKSVKRDSEQNLVAPGVGVVVLIVFARALIFDFCSTFLSVRHARSDASVARPRKKRPFATVLGVQHAGSDERVIKSTGATPARRTEKFL